MPIATGSGTEEKNRKPSDGSKPKPPPPPAQVTDTSVGGNQGTETQREMMKRTKVDRLGIPTIGARLDARERRERDLIKETRPEIFSAAREAGFSRAEARTLTKRQAKQLNDRVDMLDAGLLSVAPDLAADLVMSQIPTDELREASAAVHEAASLYAQKLRKDAREEWFRQNQIPMMGTALREADNDEYLGENPEAMLEPSLRAKLREVQDPDIQKWLAELGEFNEETKPVTNEAALQYLRRLYVVATHPEVFEGHVDGAMEEAYNALLNEESINIYAKIGQKQDGSLVYVPDDADVPVGLKLAEGVGQAFMAPLTFSGAAGGAALRGVGAEGIADQIGGIARAAEQGIGYGVRALEGGAIGLIAGPEYWPTWQEFKAGKATPVSDFFFNNTGLEREEYEGLAAFLDMSADFLFAEAGIRGGAALKRINTVPGVRYTGMEFLTKERWGRTIGDKLADDVLNTPQAKVKTTLINRWKGIDAKLAENLSRETTKDGVLRVAAEYIDDVAEYELPKARKRLEWVDEQIKVEQRNAAAREISGRAPEGEASAIGRGEPVRMRSQGDIGQIGMDDGTYVYRIDKVEVAESYRTRGVDPEMSPTKKAYFSNDPFKTYDLSDRVTSQGAGGAEFNIYRVKMDKTVMEQPGEFISRERIAPEGVEVYTDQGWQPVGARAGKGMPDPVAMDALIAERTSLWQRITDLEEHRPMYQFPKPSYMRGWMRGTKGRNTRLGRIMQGLFGETGKIDLSKMTDDFSPHQRKVTYTSFRRNPNDLIDAARKQMNVAKVPREGQVAMIEDLLKVKSPQGLFNWAVNYENVLKASATRGHTRWLTPEMDETFKFAPRTMEERISSPVTREYDTTAGKPVSKVENSLIDDAGEPMLTRPTQFLQEFWLPDMGLLREATSSIRWVDRWSKTQPWLTRAGWESLHTPARSIKTIGVAIRHIVRPGVLLSPRLWGKIQFDQTLRRFAMGYMNKRWLKEGIDYTIGGIPIIPKKARALLTEYGMDETALGSLFGEAENLAKVEPKRVDTTRVDPNPSNPQAVRIVDSRIDQLEAIAGDPVMRRYITDGPEGLVKWLREHPDSRNGRWFQEYEQYLAEHGKTINDWLIALEEEVTSATFNNIGLRRALATKKWKTGQRHTTGAGGEAARLSSDLRTARAELSRTEAGIPRMELLRRIDELDRRLSRLSEEALDSDGFPITDRDAMKAEIFRLWENDQIKMPDEVLVNRRAPAFEARPPKDIHERILAQTSKVSEKLYGWLRPLGKFDYSRRSTFTAVFRQTREDLVNRFKKASDGVEPNKTQLARIEEQAAHRAAYITSDLHYDISARSSFDQAMKDLFWFSAVYREQMITWGYKVPARSYWPIGAPLRLHEAYAIIDGLQGMGILEWDEYEYRDETGVLQSGRNLVMNVPFFTPLIQKMQNNTEVGKLNVEGLNPLTPGTAGALPTLSPVFELVLTGAADRAPDELKPFFEIMADLITFDGDLEEGPSFMPTALRDALGILGIEVPYNQLSPAAWGEAYRKGRVQATKWAMSELAEEGILPPEEAEEATEKAVKAVYDELGIAQIESKLTDTERGYLTGELTELETEGLTDKLSPEEILLLKDYMDQSATIRAEYADSAEAGGEAYEAYLDKVEERKEFYRNTNVFINLMGSLLFPGRFSDANGVTSAGERFYDEKQKALDSGEYSYEDGSIYDWQNAYLRKHPEAYPYSVGAHPGKYGTPTWQGDVTMEPSLWVEKALQQTHYWMDEAEKDPETGEIKAKDTVPEGNKREVEEQFRERDLVNLAVTRTVDIASLKKHDLDALGLPQFAGSEKALAGLQRAARILEQRNDSDLSDDEVETLYRQYEQNLKNVTAKYGEDGEKMLQWFKATPAERLRRANYFVTPVSNRNIIAANTIASRATADGTGLFSEEDIWTRINFYNRIEDERQSNPAFDRELRRAELALGERGLEGRVATYEYLFFNIDEEWFGHYGTIAEGMK